MDQKLVLSTYRNIIEIIKTNTVRDLNEAISNGQIEISEFEKERLAQLVETLIVSHALNGYSQLQRITKSAGS